MSFILDALKKSETDRQRQSSPALFEVKVAQPRRRFPLWAVGLGVLLGVNVLVLVWVLLREPRAAAAAAEPLAANNASANGAVTNSAPPGMVTVPATVTIPTTVNIPINSAPSITMGAGNPEPGVVAPSSTPPLAEEPQLSRHEPSVPPDYDSRDYAPAVSVTRANAAAAQRAGSIPSRDEVLAQGVQLPDLRLDLHVYAVDPAQRFVFVNMRKLREGEMLPEGVRVDRITPTGAELSYRGTRFSIEGN
ncbi:MAG: general secretion pathway protein GspB [Pseudomonadota bacterium]